MKKKHIFLILCMVVILAVAGYAFNLFKSPNLNIPFNFSSSSQQTAVQKVKTLYEVTNPGLNVTVSQVEEVSGMYKVLFKATDNAGATSYREAYVTKDGELMSESMVLVNQSINQITRIHNFVDCLDNKNVKIFGINQTATILQFNILGGAYATKLYVSCDGNLAQQCVNMGVDTVPSVFYKNKAYPGVQSLDFLQNLTSCAL
ncbi:MAG: hypothetical protein HYW22_02540 [Candidatus Aenigmarchaeota archaeon]|nr:hypothetical protein [Candidatus Aenigmarchaeota archaeon]